MAISHKPSARPHNSYIDSKDAYNCPLLSWDDRILSYIATNRKLRRSFNFMKVQSFQRIVSTFGRWRLRSSDTDPPTVATGVTISVLLSLMALFVLWNLFFIEDAQPATIALSTASIPAGHTLYVLLYQQKDKQFRNSFGDSFRAPLQNTNKSSLSKG